MPIVVDGYNLIHAIASMGEEFQGFTEDDMCRYISEYCVKVRNQCSVVFDGTGPPDKSGLAWLKNCEIYFSGPHKDADTWIEEKIEDSSAPKNLIVVSTDRRLRDAATRRKAISIQSHIFWAMVIQELDRKAPTPEPQEKRKGLTEGETDQWMNIFGLDD